MYTSVSHGEIFTVLLKNPTENFPAYRTIRSIVL